MYAHAGRGSPRKPGGARPGAPAAARPARPCARQPVRASAPRRWRPERRRGTSGSRRAPGACLAADPRPRHTDVNRSARPAPRGPRPPPPSCSVGVRGGRPRWRVGAGRCVRPPSSSLPSRGSALQLRHLPLTSALQPPLGPDLEPGLPFPIPGTRVRGNPRPVSDRHCPLAPRARRAERRAGRGEGAFAPSMALGHKLLPPSSTRLTVGKTEAGAATRPGSPSKKATELAFNGAVGLQPPRQIRSGFCPLLNS